MIVETEAYHESEPACHAYVGRTARTDHAVRPRRGRAYVYFSYGMHALLNVVCEPEGVGAAVLIRALEPIDGIELMRERRGLVRDEDLCSGPGKLTQALGVGLELNGDGPLRRPDPARAARRARGREIVVGTRIGITKAPDLPWRFCAAGSRHVSRPWPPGAREALAPPPRAGRRRRRCRRRCWRRRRRCDGACCVLRLSVAAAGRGVVVCCWRRRRGRGRGVRRRRRGGAARASVGAVVVVRLRWRTSGGRPLLRASRRAFVGARSACSRCVWDPDRGDHEVVPDLRPGRCRPRPARRRSRAPSTCCRSGSRPRRRSSSCR